MSVVRQICLKHTYQHTFMFDFKYWYVWNSTIYVWSQTLMSEARQICLKPDKYVWAKNVCMKFIVIYVWKPHTSVWNHTYMYGPDILGSQTSSLTTSCMNCSSSLSILVYIEMMWVSNSLYLCQLSSTHSWFLDLATSNLSKRLVGGEQLM